MFDPKIILKNETLNHDIPETVDRFDESFHPRDEEYSYFVDATTGEIIGGDESYYFIKKLIYE